MSDADELFVTASPAPVARFEPTTAPHVSFVVVTYGTGWVVIEMLASLAATVGSTPVEVVVVDNPHPRLPQRVVAELLLATAGVTVVRPASNLGFAGGCELGVRHTRGTTLGFVNPDVVFPAGWLDPLLAVLDGADLGALDDARLAELRLTRVGMLFQHHDLIPTLNAAENVALPLLLAGAQRHAALARAERLVERLGIAGRGAELPAELSLGERQRLCVARALVNEPRLLLADEPTAGLDSVAADEVMRLLSELVDEAGLTVLLATHDVRAAAYADRAFRLSGGRLEPA